MFKKLLVVFSLLPCTVFAMQEYEARLLNSTPMPLKFQFKSIHREIDSGIKQPLAAKPQVVTHTILSNEFPLSLSILDMNGKSLKNYEFTLDDVRKKTNNAAFFTIYMDLTADLRLR